MPRPSLQWREASGRRRPWTAIHTGWRDPCAEFCSRGGGVQGGWVGLWGGTPALPGDPELLEARKKFFGLN